MAKKRVLVFASGGPRPGQGGTSARNLLERCLVDSGLNIEVCGLISSNPRGGVYDVAQEYGFIREFRCCGAPKESDYERFEEEFMPDLNVSLGWLKAFCGNDKTKTINSHPADPKRYGGPGMFGDEVHRRWMRDAEVAKALNLPAPRYSEIVMHFVPSIKEAGYDTGPIFFEYPILMPVERTLESIRKHKLDIQHTWEPYLINLVANGLIMLDPETDEITVPKGYPYLPRRNSGHS